MNIFHPTRIAQICVKICRPSTYLYNNYYNYMPP